MVDGVHFGEQTCLVVLAIDITGVKHRLAIVEGATENATVVRELLAGLGERGLDGRSHVLKGPQAHGSLRLSRAEGRVK